MPTWYFKMFTAVGLDFSDSESAAIRDINLCLLNLNKRN